MQVQPGWDLVFIARKPIRNANYHEMDAACARLVRRAHLLRSAPEQCGEMPHDAGSSLNAEE